MQQTTKEYNSKHDWVGKLTHRELCKKSRFVHDNKCFIHKLDSVLKNETYKIL